MPRFQPRNGLLERQWSAVYSVCRIDVDGRPAGTGFLVGPDLVLTNFHVVARALPPAPERCGKPTLPVRCRFDIDQAENHGLTEGWPTMVAIILAASPYEPYEVDQYHPAADAEAGGLDFALLQISERMSERPMPNGLRRDWIPLTSMEPPTTLPTRLNLVQHPAGGFARVDSSGKGFTGYFANSAQRRLTYTLADDGGSSGSPVLDDDYQLFGLHNWGGADSRRGVPAWLIREKLEKLELGAHFAAPSPRTDIEMLRDRLVGLRDLVADGRDFRALLDGRRDALDDLTARLKRLSAFKQLHDELHELQISHLPAIRSYAERTDETSRRMLRQASTNVIRLIEAKMRPCLAEFADDPRFGRRQASLIDELHLIAERLRDETVSTLVSEAVSDFRLAIWSWMKELNEAIRIEAQGIDFETFKTLLADSGEIYGFVAGFDPAPGAAERLSLDILSHVERHGDWQRAEDRQSLMEALVGTSGIADRPQFLSTWRRTWQDIIRLVGDGGGDPNSVELLREGSRLDGVLQSDAWADAPGAFSDLLFRSRQAFWDVDRATLRKTEELKIFAQPLQNLLALIEPAGGAA